MHFFSCENWKFLQPFCHRLSFDQFQKLTHHFSFWVGRWSRGLNLALGVGGLGFKSWVSNQSVMCCCVQSRLVPWCSLLDIIGCIILGRVVNTFIFGISCHQHANLISLEMKHIEIYLEANTTGQVIAEMQKRVYKFHTLGNVLLINCSHLSFHDVMFSTLELESSDPRSNRVEALWISHSSQTNRFHIKVSDLFNFDYWLCTSNYTHLHNSQQIGWVGMKV